MSYSHLLVAVAPTPESRVLINKAVSIARPLDARVSLITLATDPELYNQFAAPMLENLRDLMHEETRDFLSGLAKEADYPIDNVTIASGELSHHIKDFLPAASRGSGDMRQSQPQPVFARHLLGESIVGSSGVDVLLVSLEKADAFGVSLFPHRVTPVWGKSRLCVAIGSPHYAVLPAANR